MTAVSVVLEFAGLGNVDARGAAGRFVAHIKTQLGKLGASAQSEVLSSSAGAAAVRIFANGPNRESLVRFFQSVPMAFARSPGVPRGAAVNVRIESVPGAESYGTGSAFARIASPLGPAQPEPTARRGVRMEPHTFDDRTEAEPAPGETGIFRRDAREAAPEVVDLQRAVAVRDEKIRELELEKVIRERDAEIARLKSEAAKPKKKQPAAPDRGKTG